jgi:hypothetical protein
VCAQVNQDRNFLTDILIPILVVLGFLAGVVYAVVKLMWVPEILSRFFQIF